jgi:hypothetical protein
LLLWVGLLLVVLLLLLLLLLLVQALTLAPAALRGVPLLRLFRAPRRLHELRLCRRD